MAGIRWQKLAARLAAGHSHRPFGAFYTTPRLRVTQTAEIITHALRLPSTIDPELRGPDHGDADGQPWADVKTAFQGPPQHAPDHQYADGSETWNVYLDRAMTALQQILARHDGARILIAAHGETVEAAHTLLLNLPREAWQSVQAHVVSALGALREEIQATLPTPSARRSPAGRQRRRTPSNSG